MAEKQDMKNIEADLKRMLNMNVEGSTLPKTSDSSQGQTGEKITEVDLKRMLNMNIGGILPKVPDSSQGQKGEKITMTSKTDQENAKSSQSAKKKKRGKGGKGGLVSAAEPKDILLQDNQVNNSALDTTGGQDGNLNKKTEDDSTKKKKKKKRPRRRKKDKTEGDAAEGGESESESGDDDEPSPKQEARKDVKNMKETSQTTPLCYGFQPKYLDDKLTPAIMNELEAQRIYPLKKKSAPFPKALYFCRLCDYHCDNIPVCRQHASDARHRRRLEIMIQDKKFKNLPTPSKDHYTALTNMVEEIYREQGLTDGEMKAREDIAELMQEFLQQVIPDLKLRIYGSSLTGFGLKRSNLNMDLVIPAGMNPAKGLSLIYKTLKQSDICKEVRSNFQAKVPSVLFKSPCGGVDCEIAIGSDLAYFTGRYLTLYDKLDPRLRKLAVIFRYWAKVCELDDQSSGTLPSYCYDLMTVYFLQQDSPQVLPVLWKDLSEEALRRPKTHQDIFNMLEELQEQPWKCCNDDSVGQLWRNLLLFYGVKFEMSETVVCVRSQKLLRRHEKKWKSRRVAIEDPFSQKRNVARSMHNTRVFDYFYNCLRKACLYFSVPTSNNSHLFVDNDNSGKTSGTNKVQSQSGQHKMAENIPGSVDREMKETAKLEVDEHVHGEKDNELEGSGMNGTESDASIKPHILMESANESAIEMSELEESIEQLGGVKDGELGSTGGKIVKVENCDADEIESLSSSDDFKSHVGAKIDTVECDNCDNETRESNSASNGEEIGATRVPVTEVNINEHIVCESKEISSSNKTPEDASDTSADPAVDHSGMSSAKSLSTSPGKVNTSDVNSAVELQNQSRFGMSNCMEVSKDSVKVEAEEKSVVEGNSTPKGDSTSQAVIEDNKSDMEESDSDEFISDSDREGETPDSSPLALKQKKKTLATCDTTRKHEYNFVFSSQTLTDGKGPSTFCQICEKEGHHKNNCPEDELPSLQELPPLTPVHLDILSYVIEKVPRDFSLTKEEIKEREYVRKNIEHHLLDEFPDCMLQLFGSSKNGFGFHQSDLDICVTFRNKSPSEVNFIECIDAIAKRLKSHRGLYNVFPITTAKVPIVKFKHRNSQLEGDISMYNVLALQNTKLLNTYAYIDRRAMVLGYAIKVFAKVCDIGDASKGSLSSYAYMLLMLHYLQHTQPPVIPVLQELRDKDTTETELMIDGWNAWFYEDLKIIPKIWPHYGKNQQSVGELWLGFFRYYMEEFNIVEQVVTIKQFEPLTKFEKLWNGKCIAIEDPFDLNHNLGGGLSRRMNQYILRTFVHARVLYGKSIGAVPNGFDTPEDYFFDNMQLTEGKPPADRLCRVCSKIGHIAKECPRLLARKEREAAERKRRDEMRRAQENNNNSQNHPGHNNNQRRAASSRSKSDPADYGSPTRHAGSHVYHRQHSESLDNRHTTPGKQDSYRKNYQPPLSPQSGQGHSFQNRYPQPQSPKTSTPSYGYKQQYQPQQHGQYNYRTGHPSNLFSRSNQSEFSNSNRNSNHSANQMRLSTNIPANQNMDPRNVPNSANQSKDYSSSPNHSAAYMNRGPKLDGPRPPHVSYVENGISSSRAGFTNPILISPNAAYPPLGMSHFPFYPAGTPLSVVNSSMSASAGGPYPCPYPGMGPAGNVQGGPATLSAPVMFPMSSVMGAPVYVQSGPLSAPQAEGYPLIQGNRHERKVNVNNNVGPLTDVGITVKNDLYKGVKNKAE